MAFKSQIPNLFTLSNLLCGSFSVYFTCRHSLGIAALLILAGAFFDFFDGLVARLLGVSGEMGKQLDSLADLISFGLAPAFIAMHLAGIFNANADVSILAYVPMLLVAFAAYRLAKFNIDERQTSEFIGMPTPANALFWLSFPLIARYSSDISELGFVYSQFSGSSLIIALVSIIFGFLMISEIPMISLKFTDLNWRGNEFRFILLGSSMLLLIFFWLRALPIIIVLYITLSITKTLIKRTWILPPK